MNKTKFLSLTASLVLATTFTLSCEDKEKDKPATAADTASTAETATPATPPETAEKTVLDKRETFTDSRDGKTYKKVTIGKQTWMAENLNYEAKGSKCYGEGGEVIIGWEEENPIPITETLSSAELQANCAKYGRLYDWEAVMKACPSGWHLPSENEWIELMNFLVSSKEDVRYQEYENTGQEYYLNAGKYLKSKSGWMSDDDGKFGNGTDEFGFSALPGGGGELDGSFRDVGNSGGWWSATEISASRAYGRCMSYNYAEVHRYYYDKSNLVSVRCVQD